MPIYVANKLVKAMIRAGNPISRASVLLLGITFKENCPDVRNTKVADIYHELISFGINVTVYDPWAIAEEVGCQHGITLADSPQGTYDGIVLAVAHDEFRELDIRSLCRNEQSIVYDLKAMLDRSIVSMRI
jgi:UDP-N-acetyl-D-galactosamine dehydrogenase